MSIIESKFTREDIKSFSEEIRKNYYIPPQNFDKYNVKRGLRNSDGTGVMAGITRICSVEGYYIQDGEKTPKDGHLIYRGVELTDIIDACLKENRFGFEEVVWLLLFGTLPTKEQLEFFINTLSNCRELPSDFIEDMIMKAPSNDIMNKMARCVLALYSYDENPDSLSLDNVIRQCINLIAQVPAIMSYAYQVKRRHFYHKSMYIHPLMPGYTTAQTILRSIRSDKKFTDEEAKLLDLCLICHAEHGGGNNSTFTTRVLTSSGTDTYSAISGGIGSLKGPRHGGANLKVSQMLEFIKQDVPNIKDEGAIADELQKILSKEAGDGSGLIYGMGHAVYTLSDPRAKILKEKAREFSAGTEFEDDFILLDTIEKLTPQIIMNKKGISKAMCANVDLYSGLIYRILRVPADLFTPIFTVARIAGWSAHRIEEIMTSGRIMRPAYKNVNSKKKYVPISER